MPGDQHRDVCICMFCDNVLRIVKPQELRIVKPQECELAWISIVYMTGSYQFQLLVGSRMLEDCLWQLHPVNYAYFAFVRFGYKLLSLVPCHCVLSGMEGIELIVDKETNQCRGFGFVAFYNNAAADAARRVLSRPEFRIQGRQLTVTWADPKRNEVGAEFVSCC